MSLLWQTYPANDNVIRNNAVKLPIPQFVCVTSSHNKRNDIQRVGLTNNPAMENR